MRRPTPRAVPYDGLQRIDGLSLEAQEGGLAVNQSSTITAGLDLGDRYSHSCLIDTESGEVVEEGGISTNPKAFERRFSGCAPMRVVIEVGTHSPWVSRLLKRLGHDVLVANARKLRLIYGKGRKNDRLDAENLARLARLDPKRPSPR